MRGLADAGSNPNRRSRYREGLLQYQRRLYPNSTQLQACDADRSLWGVDISSTYFDYPKAPTRIFAIIPWVHLAVVLRHPLDRLLSAYNVRWMTWLCGKLIWSRKTSGTRTCTTYYYGTTHYGTTYYATTHYGTTHYGTTYYGEVPNSKDE